MAESIDVLGSGEAYDLDGRLIPGGEHRAIPNCVVFPTGSAKPLEAADMSGAVATLSVLAPAGTQVSEGDIVRIRGENFRVQAPAFDWSTHRTPVTRRHQPRVAFTVQRGET